MGAGMLKTLLLKLLVLSYPLLLTLPFCPPRANMEPAVCFRKASIMAIVSITSQ